MSNEEEKKDREEKQEEKEVKEEEEAKEEREEKKEKKGEEKQKDSREKLKLDADARARIESEIEEFERRLRKEFRRESDKELIRKRKKKFREKLLERELRDDERDIQDIRQEEHFNISTNLFLSLLLMVIFTGWALLKRENLKNIAMNITASVVKNFNWFYVLASSAFLIYLLYLALSRFGSVVLGDPDETPEFSDVSWYAMLFSAGMGTGLLFWGAAEPLHHFIHPPLADPGTAEAARNSMVYTAFHRGLHAWGYIYRRSCGSSLLRVQETEKIPRIFQCYGRI